MIAMHKETNMSWKTLMVLLGSLALVLPVRAVAQGSPVVSSTAGSTGSSAARARVAAGDVSIGSPGALTVDRFGGNLYIADAYNDQVRKVDSNGIITTIMPPASWPAKWPQGIATDSAGSLYISYAYGQVVKRLAEGIISTLALSDCGADLTAGFCEPEQIALDSDGNIYVPDGYCRVRKIAPDGTIVTIAGYEGTQNYT
jgi:hypothetical protein